MCPSRVQVLQLGLSPSHFNFLFLHIMHARRLGFGTLEFPPAPFSFAAAPFDSETMTVSGGVPDDDDMLIAWCASSCAERQTFGWIIGPGAVGTNSRRLGAYSGFQIDNRRLQIRQIDEDGVKSGLLSRPQVASLWDDGVFAGCPRTARNSISTRRKRRLRYVLIRAGAHPEGFRVCVSYHTKGDPGFLDLESLYATLLES